MCRWNGGMRLNWKTNHSNENVYDDDDDDDGQHYPHYNHFRLNCQCSDQIVPIK